MMRRLAVFLLCAPIVFGQSRRTRVPPLGPPPPTQVRFFDAGVTDAEGRPVPGLSAGDFELTQAGEPQKITNLTWFDNRQHLTKSLETTPDAAPVSPRGFELEPEDIHRNIVLIVDDLGLTPDRVVAVQKLLREFVTQQLEPDDRIAILRTSSGVGGEQQLSTAHQAASAQIEQIQPLGRGMAGASIASAIWQAIRWAADGLRTLPGRKSVVLISEHLDAPILVRPESEFVRISVASAAHAATMVFYTVDPRGPAQPPQSSTLAWLVKETGGTSAPDLARVLRDQEGYYVLGFHPTNELAASTPPVLLLHGKVLNLRWRFGFLNRPESRHVPAPADRTTAIQMQMGATGGPDIRTRITPLFTGFSRTGAIVDVLLHIDARDLSVLRDTKGTRHVSAEIQLGAFGDNGKVTGAQPAAVNMTMTDSEYKHACEEGLVYTARLTVPSPGGYQIRAMVADGPGDRVGSAMQFVEIPEANQGKLALSGLVLKGEASTKPLPQGVSVQPETAAVRVFKPGVPIAFSYVVFNALLGPAKESRLKVSTRIYATGREVYRGLPIDLEFPAANGAARQVNGKVQLDSRLSPGEYVIEVEVSDTLAKDDSPRVAIQYITFDVRE